MWSVCREAWPCAGKEVNAIMEYTRKVGGGAGPDGLPGAGPERTLAFGAVFLPRADAKESGDKGAPAQDNVLPWP